MSKIFHLILAFQDTDKNRNNQNAKVFLSSASNTENVIINLFGETTLKETTKLYSPNINVSEAFKFRLNISISIL